MFVSRISAGAKEKLLTRASGKPDANLLRVKDFDSIKLDRKHFFLQEFCTVIFWHDCNGKGNSKSFITKCLGKSPTLESYFKPRKGLFLSVYVGRFF